MSDTPKWVVDLDKAVKNLPFGEIEVKITRHRSTTSKVTYIKDAMINPKTNEQALSDLKMLITSLQTSFFNGKVEFALDFHGGTIKLITIKNKETKNYGQSQG